MNPFWSSFAKETSHQVYLRQIWLSTVVYFFLTGLIYAKTYQGTFWSCRSTVAGGFKCLYCFLLVRFCRCFEEFVFRHSIVKKLICFTLLVSIAKDFTLWAVIDAKFEPPSPLPPPFFKGVGIDLTKNPKKKGGGGWKNHWRVGGILLVWVANVTNVTI